MKDDDVGTIILLVHGDEAGSNDLRVLMKAIVADAHLRRRCKSIGNLARDIPERDRQGYAELCLQILYSWAPPPDDNNQLGTREVIGVSLRPLRGTAWADHVQWDAQQGKGYISAFLFDVITALEGLWCVAGHLAKRD